MVRPLWGHRCWTQTTGGAQKWEGDRKEGEKGVVTKMGSSVSAPRMRNLVLRPPTHRVG